MDNKLGNCLLILARNTLAAEFGLLQMPEPEHPDLKRPGATFVTLTLGGELRGCIGSLEACRPLDDDVRANAGAAAFRDPRFPPLSRAEFTPIRVEVSLLSPATAMSFGDESDLIRQLRPGIDGLILEYEGHRSTFLPQVWESLPAPGDFFGQLKRKAGLSGDFWAPGVRLSRYEVQKWKEPSKQ